MPRKKRTLAEPVLPPAKVLKQENEALQEENKTLRSESREYEVEKRVE